MGEERERGGGGGQKKKKKGIFTHIVCFACDLRLGAYHIALATVSTLGKQ